MRIIDSVETGRADPGAIAEALKMTESELASSLTALQTSFSRILQETRQELASEYIVRTDLTINEISYMLGFTDCSNFARSFKRWTGKTPRQFRKE